MADGFPDGAPLAFLGKVARGVDWSFRNNPGAAAEGGPPPEERNAGAQRADSIDWTTPGAPNPALSPPETEHPEKVRGTQTVLPVSPDAKKPGHPGSGNNAAPDLDDSGREREIGTTGGELNKDEAPVEEAVSLGKPERTPEDPSDDVAKNPNPFPWEPDEKRFFPPDPGQGLGHDWPRLSAGDFRIKKQTRRSSGLKPLFDSSRKDVSRGEGDRSDSEASAPSTVSTKRKGPPTEPEGKAGRTAARAGSSVRASILKKEAAPASPLIDHQEELGAEDRPGNHVPVKKTPVEGNKNPPAREKAFGRTAPVLGLAPPATRAAGAERRSGNHVPVKKAPVEKNKNPPARERALGRIEPVLRPVSPATRAGSAKPGGRGSGAIPLRAGQGAADKRRGVKIGKIDIRIHGKRKPEVEEQPGPPGYAAHALTEDWEWSCHYGRWE